LTAAQAGIDALFNLHAQLLRDLVAIEDACGHEWFDLCPRA